MPRTRQPAQPLYVHGPPPPRRYRQWLHDEARKTQAVLGKFDRTLLARADEAIE